jgi:hypothetical protein
MFQKIFSAIFFLIIIVACHAQLTVDIKWSNTANSKKNDSIFYNTSQKLTWENFKLNTTDKSDAAALTTSGFGYDAGLSMVGKKGTFTITVYCYFLQSKSWYKTGHKNDYVLNHEQKHFDIAYYGACLFMKKLKEAKFTTANYSSLLDSIYNDAYAAMNSMQDEYDDETDNGRNKIKQEEWNKKIEIKTKALIN